MFEGSSLTIHKGGGALLSISPLRSLSTVGSEDDSHHYLDVFMLSLNPQHSNLKKKKVLSRFLHLSTADPAVKDTKGNKTPWGVGHGESVHFVAVAVIAMDFAWFSVLSCDKTNHLKEAKRAEPDAIWHVKVFKNSLLSVSPWIWCLTLSSVLHKRNCEVKVLKEKKYKHRNIISKLKRSGEVM